MTNRSNDQHDAIARRAYEIYRQRGGADGNELDDWIQAEAELDPYTHPEQAPVMEPSPNARTAEAGQSAD
jgi:hypothetical protein